MMNEFDRDGDGTVNCAEFLLAFFRIGFEARNKALQRYASTPLARLSFSLTIASADLQRSIPPQLARDVWALALRLRKASRTR